MTNLLHINDKFVKTKKKKKIENSTASHNARCNSCAKITCCSSELIFTFLYACSSIQNASYKLISCAHLSSVNFALHPTPQTKI